MSQILTTICDTIGGFLLSHSVGSKVFNRIAGHGRGWVFTPAHFKDLGSRTAVATALKRHKQNGTIRQIARGLYDFPRKDSELGVLAPQVDKIIAALEVRFTVRLQPSGAYAANLLGLSDQVPMRMVFLTDGHPHELTVGKRHMILRRTTPKNMKTAGRLSGTVIQALRWLGKHNVDENTVAILKQRLNLDEKAQLMKDSSYSPVWIAEVIMSIAQEGIN